MANLELYNTHLILSLLILSASASRAASALSDAESLLALKDAWGLNYSSWTGDNPCAAWTGVQCDNQQRVKYLNLSNTGISGSIPTAISNLDHLINLDLSNQRGSKEPMNSISGDLSPLSSLTELQSLNISFNGLTLSGFPTSILNLTNLIALLIDNNFIGGSIPKELARLTKLEIFYLGNNSFTGTIPPELGNLANLQELSMWNINLGSKLPPELGNLVNLRYLNLHDCNLYGGLPIEFANLKNIEKMYLYRNLLTGEIPDSWGNLTKIKQLYLHFNYLTKYIPSSLFQLPNLYNLSLDHNLLYGDLNLSSSNLSILSVTCNFLSGSKPTVPSTKLVNDSGNCFTGYDTNEKIKCSQYPYYDCTTFFSDVPSGSCPSCPQLEVLENSTTCVCTVGSTSGGQSSHLVAKVVASIFGIVAFLMLVGGGIWWILFFRRKKRSRKDFWEGPDGVQHYLYRDLSRATENFSSSHEIGHGGFGKVFLGLVEGKTVAIKRAHSSSVQSTDGFRNEVVLLSRLHHRNLVRLLGFCEEDNNQILVYEYMPNGNLHELLFKDTRRENLDWLRRLDIAVEIAQGLEYLHSFADPPVIHRDVKPSNVLLDENMVAKLSDFGISKVAPEFQTQFSTRPAGTVGYIDPQYILREQLTTASDVYSFGMVLMELISGQKSIDNTRLDDHNLIEWAKLKMRNGEYRSIVDPMLGDAYPEPVYMDMIRLAIDCASFNLEDRPSMKVVVSILDGCRWSVAPHLVHEVHESSADEDFTKDSGNESTPQSLVKENESFYLEDKSTTLDASHLLPR